MKVEAYTKPERAAEIAAALRVRSKIMRCGGCPVCVHRVEGWGRAACGLWPAKVFPACVDSGNGFTLDTARSVR